jgi:hypothetical protein
MLGLQTADWWFRCMSRNSQWYDLWSHYSRSSVLASLNIMTRKNAQVVTNLQKTFSNAVPTTCQQDVFALFVPSLMTRCQRLVDNLLQGCWAQQICYKLFQQLVIVLQCNSLLTSLLTTWKNNNIVTTCWQACYKPVANTSCWQVVRFLSMYINH